MSAGDTTGSSAKSSQAGCPRRPQGIRIAPPATASALHEAPPKFASCRPRFAVQLTAMKSATTVAWHITQAIPNCTRPTWPNRPRPSTTAGPLSPGSYPRARRQAHNSHQRQLCRDMESARPPPWPRVSLFAQQTVSFAVVHAWLRSGCSGRCNTLSHRLRCSASTPPTRCPQ